MHTLPLAAPALDVVDVLRRMLPASAVDLTRMIRYRGGTYSHTVDTVSFTDGSIARTDLIRLNPNIEAYSLDFAGIAPTRPSRYDADTWSAVPHLRAREHEAEVDWILRNSFPMLSTAEVSRRLRAAGYPLGTRNIAEHEAIAGTQAAIWHLTNGLDLDARPLNVPVVVREDYDGVTVEFDGERELSAFAVVVSSARGAVLTLHKSDDGTEWEEVPASRVVAPAGRTPVAKALGVGSTLSHNRFGRNGHGHRYYRLAVDGEAALSELTFELHGSRVYRNAEPVVYLYDCLLSGAAEARRVAVAPALIADDVVVDGDLVGPFRLVVTDAAAVRPSPGHVVVDADGAAITGPLAPGDQFYLRVPPGVVESTLTIEVPGLPGGFGGRVITGVARDEVGDRFTPLALAVPAQTVVEFDVRWIAGAALGVAVSG